MAFGAELKDFVAGFQSGYKMVDSPEEKQYKRDKRRREQEEFDRTGKWHDEDTAYRADTFEYRKDRDATEDTHWDKNYDRQGEQYDWTRARTDRQDNRDEMERGRSQGRFEEEQKYKRDALRLGAAKEMGPLPGAFEQNQDRYITPTSPAIPDGATGGDQTSANPLLHRSSYAIDDDAVTGGDNQWIAYANQGATRNKPINTDLHAALEKVLPSLGVQAKVFSGGQDATGSHRTGSHRHDNGGAADVLFYKDGKQLDWADPNDRPIFEAIVSRGKEAGLTGFGAGDGYMQRGSMHIGFGTPAVWGAGGDSNNAPDWLRKAYYGTTKTKKAVNASVGGMIGAIPDDDADDQPQGVEVADAGNSPVLPEEGPRPTPRPQYEGTSEGNKEEATDDPWELGRRAVRDGLHTAISQSGADKDGALNDPELEKLRLQYIRGYGAAPSQMMRQVIDKIDPDKKMEPGQRNMMAMGTVYRFYMDQGETEKAKEAAASMVQYYRQSSQKFLGLAQAAAQEGNLDNAAKAAVAAYANVPNGRDMKIDKNQDGSFTINVTDAKSGKQITNKVVSPKDFAAAAMQFNPGTFDEEILAAAGAPAEKFDDASIQDVGNVEQATRTYLDGLKIDGKAITDVMEPKKLSALNAAAASIASTKDNQMGPEAAADFAANLMSFNSDDPNSDKANYSVRPIRGNPDRVRVTSNGQTVVMSANQLEALTGARGEMAKDRAKGRDEAKVNTKWWNDQSDLLKKGVEAFGGSLFSSDNPPEVKSQQEERAGRIRDARSQVGAQPPASAIPDSPPDTPVAPSATAGRAENIRKAREQMGAIPDQNQEAAPVDDNTQEISRLLDARAKIIRNAKLSGSNPEHYGLSEINGRLRQLGYTD